jgi:flagellar M-ring protein FliF
MWAGMERRARVGLVTGVIVVAGVCLALGLWAYRSDYQVLFADLAARDAAAMTAELDKLKAPYRLAGDGNTILVPQDQVYKLRLKLMGKDTPLYGAVGFEVFNNADLGMTEFVQKVNYQRAIQGELTRTIQAIDEVQSARVHLALPEQGLFKRAAAKAKASVTLMLKPGKTIGAEQVTGIQRLVAASVPDVQPDDVTVLDQHGVALTRNDGSDRGGASASAQLDSKRGTEEYLQKKVDQVLERTFGAGQAVASIDVVLNLDQSKVTTEEVLPSAGKSAQGNPAGVVIRERYSTQGEDTPRTAPGAKDGAAADASMAEAEYQVGRRVEQLEHARGGVRRMTVAVLVRQPLSAYQAAQLKEVVGTAVGINVQRGDAIVVQSMDEFVAAKTDDAQARLAPVAAAAPAAPAAPAAAAGVASQPAYLVALAAAATVAVLAGLLGAALARRRRVVLAKVVPAAPAPLSEAARAAMLLQLRDWIEHGAADNARESR